MTEVMPKLSQTVRDGTVYVGKGVKSERIRRITGYLVGTVDRFNHAKKAELVEDIVVHASHGAR